MTPGSKNKLARLVLVTGPSGAGRWTALNALEDIGFEVIDNIPLNLVPRLFDRDADQRSMGLGIDVRNRDFSVESFMAVVTEVGRLTGQAPELLYLDAERDILLRRYSETRRRHPMALDGSPQSGIEAEMEMLAPLRDVATRLIETSTLSPHDLRAEIKAAFGAATDQPLAVSIQSFSYKRGLPRGADQVFDCRFLINPHWRPELRDFTGQHPEVSAFIATDDHFEPFLSQIVKLLHFQLPAMQDEGKAHALMAFGCTGGKHRSVAMAETVASGLADVGWRVSIRHRELERRTRSQVHLSTTKKDNPA